LIKLNYYINLINFVSFNKLCNMWSWTFVSR